MPCDRFEPSLLPSRFSPAPPPPRPKWSISPSYSCKEFLGLDKDTTVVIWAWLYGYYSDQDADPVIDFAKMTGQGAKLAEFCKANPGVDIIKAAEPIYE